MSFSPAGPTKPSAPPDMAASGHRAERLSDADLGRNQQRIDRPPLMEVGHTGDRGAPPAPRSPTLQPSCRSTSQGWVDAHGQLTTAAHSGLANPRTAALADRAHDVRGIGRLLE